MKTQALLIASALCVLGCSQPSEPSPTPASAATEAPAADAPRPSTSPVEAGLQLRDAWARETPAGAPVGGGYLLIDNAGDSDDRLLAVESTASARVEIHQMQTVDGVMQMRHLADGLAVPARSLVELKPGGNHLMFIEPGQPFTAGSTIEATLVFEKAGRVPVSLPVRALGDAGDAVHAGHEGHGAMHGDAHEAAPADAPAHDGHGQHHPQH